MTLSNRTAVRAAINAMPSPCHEPLPARRSLAARRARTESEHVSQKERIQPGLESGNGRAMAGESRFQMSERLCSWMIGSAWRRIYQAGQCGADRALCLEKSFPNPIGRRIAQIAGQLTKSLAFVAHVDGLLQESPQALRGKEQASDLIGPPDVEGPSATVGSPSIAAIDSLRSHGLVAWMLIIKSSQVPVPNQVPRALAVRTRRPFQTPQRRLELFIRLANMHQNRLAPSLPPHHRDCRESAVSIVG